MRTSIGIAIIISLVTSSLMVAQPQVATGTLKFDAVTLKPYEPDPSAPRVISAGNCRGSDENRPNSTVPKGRCIFRHQNLRDLLLVVYPSQFPGLIPTDRLITGGPSWIDSSYFSGEGAAENPDTVTSEQLRQMVLTALKEKFKLVFHKETKDVSGYWMVPGKSGLKLQPPPPSARGPATNGVGSIRAGGLASLLSQRFQTVVVNKTGVEATQLYDFSSLPPIQEWDSTNGSLFSALEDLGVKLEPQKIAVEIVVIDHAEKTNE